MSKSKNKYNELNDRAKEADGFAQQYNLQVQENASAPVTKELLEYKQELEKVTEEFKKVQERLVVAEAKTEEYMQLAEFEAQIKAQYKTQIAELKVQYKAQAAELKAQYKAQTEAFKTQTSPTIVKDLLVTASTPNISELSHPEYNLVTQPSFGPNTLVDTVTNLLNSNDSNDKEVYKIFIEFCNKLRITSEENSQLLKAIAAKITDTDMRIAALSAAISQTDNLEQKGELYLSRAMIHLSLGNKVEAVRDVEKAAADKAAADKAAEIAAAKEATAEALKNTLLEKVKEFLTSGRPDNIMEQIKVHCKNAIENGINVYETVNDVKTLEVLASGFLSLNNPEKAEEICGKIAGISQDAYCSIYDNKILTLLAKKYSELGFYNSCIESCKKLNNISEESYQLLKAIAEKPISTDIQLAALSAAISQTDNLEQKGELYLSRAMIHLSLGNKVEAARDVEKAAAERDAAEVAEAAKIAEAAAEALKTTLLENVKVFLTSRKPDIMEQIKEHCKKAIEKGINVYEAVNDVNTLLVLASGFLSLNNQEKAEEICGKVAKISQDAYNNISDNKILSLLAKKYSELGNHNSCIASCKKLREPSEENTQFLKTIAEKITDKQWAIEILNAVEHQINDLNQRAEICLSKGKMHLLLGNNKDKATRELENAGIYNPNIYKNIDKETLNLMCEKTDSVFAKYYYLSKHFHLKLGDQVLAAKFRECAQKLDHAGHKIQNALCEMKLFLCSHEKTHSLTNSISGLGYSSPYYTNFLKIPYNDFDQLDNYCRTLIGELEGPM